MADVIQGLSLIFVLIAAGYIAARCGVVPGSDRLVLNRVSFYVATPALMYTVLQRADGAALLSPVILVIAVSALLCAGVLTLSSLRWFRRSWIETALTATAAGYVNANALGLPIAIHVLHNGALAAALALLQMVAAAPAILAMLESDRGDRAGRRSVLGRIAANPVVIASVAGVIASSLSLRTPAVILEPLNVLGESAIPMILISFGASLHGQRLRGTGGNLAPVLLASALKLLFMPGVAWLLSIALRLSPEQTLAAVTLAALPTAQNLYTYAATYQRAEAVVRDVVVLTTLGTLPVILVVQWLLA